jgi:hypothetical protein
VLTLLVLLFRISTNKTIFNPIDAGENMKEDTLSSVNPYASNTLGEQEIGLSNFKDKIKYSRYYCIKSLDA